MESEASKARPPAGGGQAAPAKPRLLKGHKGEVTCCVASRTRPGIVASSGGDGCICLFDLRCKDVLFTMDTGNEPVVSLCFKAGNEDVVYASSGTEVIGYDIHMASSWKRLESYNYNKEEINQIAFNPKSPFLATADDSGDIKICSAVQFLPWKPWSAISGGLDSKLVIWDFSKGRPQNIIDFGMSSLESHEPHGNPGQCFNPPFVHSIAVSEAEAATGLDKFCAAARGDGVVEIIDIESEFVASKLKNSSDSRRRSTSRLGEKSCTTGQRQQRRLQLDYGLGGHTAAVSCVCFSLFGERGKFILSGGTDALIKVWDWSKQFHAEEKSPDSYVTSTITLNRKVNWLTTTMADTENLIVCDTSKVIKVYTIS
ncbi:hypothetical protein Taro_023025 [Colocasia esculenta]|uniref:WD repeat-containing protein 53 n=1 Tax=Colocasia esculenta TaxID=4460 RepID=A0A843V2U8_COLES|nr:hypothetical protein [Colocasia esculenta]